MNDKELIIKSTALHAVKIAKIILPRIPEQALETLIIMGLNNTTSGKKLTSVMEFIFDESGNLPSPDEFWEVFKSVLNEKPFEFKIFGTGIKINGSDVEEIKSIYNSKKM